MLTKLSRVFSVQFRRIYAGKKSYFSWYWGCGGKNSSNCSYECKLCPMKSLVFSKIRINEDLMALVSCNIRVETCLPDNFS